MTTHQNPSQTLSFRPFTVSIEQSAIDDLHARLANTRFAAEPADTVGSDDWSAGTPVSYLREMVEHWAGDFDWRAQEERMNAYPQLLTEIDGQTIHVVHVRSANEDATPLLLLHTYPGSFVDFLDLVPHLTDHFHLVIPTIPGVGFSQPLTDGSWDSRRNARAWDRLMRGLGYESNGAIVARELAMLAPEGFLGAHVLQLFSFPSGDPAEFEKMTPADYSALEFAGWFQTVNGYATMNASRPRTVAAALSDSPVGQLAYNELVESFGNGTSRVTRDQVLTQVSLYWFTTSSGGAVQAYRAEQAVEPRVNEGRIGVAVFADDFRTMRPFAERDNTDIVSWTEHPEGGHFASMEVPEALAGAIRGFFS